MFMFGKKAALIAATLTTAVAVATVAVGMTTGVASAAQPGASQPGNYVGLDSTHRLFPTQSGHHLNAGQTESVQITGTALGQADPGALAVVVQLTSITPVATGSLTAFTGEANHGTPGNATVAFGRGQENTTTTTVELTAAGTLKVTAKNSATNYLLDLIGEYLPVPPATVSPAPKFGVANIQVSGTSSSFHKAVGATLAGNPAGDQATGFLRFTCKDAANGCNVTLDAYATATGEKVYPDLLLTKEDNTDGHKVSCEYADGADNNGGTMALTGTKDAPTAVTLGIGSTADCGGNQTGTQPVNVDHINVPGAAGQGIHYDMDIDLTFIPAT